MLSNVATLKRSESLKKGVNYYNYLYFVFDKQEVGKIL